MAPGQEIRVLVGTFMEIRKEPYTVVASYCGKERRFRKRLAFTDTYTLDVRQFDGQFEITEDRTVKALDKIASETKRVAQGVREISTILSPPSPLRPPSPMPEGVESGDSQTPPWQIDRHLPVRVAKLIGGALGMKYRQDGD